MTDILAVAGRASCISEHMRDVRIVVCQLHNHDEKGLVGVVPQQFLARILDIQRPQIALSAVLCCFPPVFTCFPLCQSVCLMLLTPHGNFFPRYHLILCSLGYVMGCTWGYNRYL